MDIPFHVGNEVEAVMNQKAKLVGNRKLVIPGGRCQRRVALGQVAYWGEVLRREDVALFNPREAFFQGQELGHFPPLARVAEIGQVKALVPGVLKPGKP